jgi:hypothetical protein
VHRTLVPAPLQSTACTAPCFLHWDGGALLPLQRWCLFGIGGLAGRPYTDPMKPATLLAVLVPLLFGGCGEKESVAEVKPVNPNLKYEAEGDAVTITECNESATGELVIPATIGGNPVTSIGHGAFIGCPRLTSITIPDGVSSIGIAAFYHCRSLTAVTFLGNAPLGNAPKAGDVFNDATSTIYRKPEAKGWGKTWGGRPVKLISEKP